MFWLVIYLFAFADTMAGVELLSDHFLILIYIELKHNNSYLSYCNSNVLRKYTSL